MAFNDDDTAADREMVIIRTVDAPRELVWQAWTQPHHIAQWWGPNGFRTTIHEMNVAVGGLWRFIMHGPDGTDYPNRIVYREIVKPERLVYDHSEDTSAFARVFRRAMPDAVPDFRTTVTFDDFGGKTKVTLRALFATAAGRDAAFKFGALEGGNQTLARMEAHLAAMKSRV